MSKPSLKEIAQMVRADIKAAIKSGALPAGIKVSVTTDYYSMGCALRLRITALPAGFPIYNPARIAHDIEHPRASQWDMPESARELYSSELRAAQELIEGFALKHQERTVYDHGDYIVSANFHIGSVNVDHDVTEPARKVAEAAYLVSKAAAASEPAAPAASKPRVYLRAVCAAVESN